MARGAISAADVRHIKPDRRQVRQPFDAGDRDRLEFPAVQQARGRLAAGRLVDQARNQVADRRGINAHVKQRMDSGSERADNFSCETPTALWPSAFHWL